MRLTSTDTHCRQILNPGQNLARHYVVEAVVTRSLRLRMSMFSYPLTNTQAPAWGQITAQVQVYLYIHPIKIY